jgi:hypothetical protein
MDHQSRGPAKGRLKVSRIVLAIGLGCVLLFGALVAAGSFALFGCECGAQKVDVASPDEPKTPEKEPGTPASGTGSKPGTRPQDGP